MILKKFFTLLALIISVVITSCESNEVPDGKWKPIKVDKQQLNFLSVGGEQTVTAVNYNSWWIGGGYEDFDQAKNEYTNYVYPTSTDGEDACTYDLLDGGWYNVSVPCDGRNTAVVKVFGNTAGTARQANIVMTVGDSFVTIKVCQQ